MVRGIVIPAAGSREIAARELTDLEDNQRAVWRSRLLRFEPTFEFNDSRSRITEREGFRGGSPPSRLSSCYARVIRRRTANAVRPMPPSRRTPPRAAMPG